jgi:GT2 family glycosyltransferase
MAFYALTPCRSRPSPGINQSESKVSIIILHLNDQSALRACLRSCQSIQYDNYEIIIIENGSFVPLELDELRGLAGHVSQIIKSPINVGYAKGNNLGIRAALDHGSDYVMLLNDDTEVAPNFLTILVGVGNDNDHVGALGPCIYYFDEPERIWFAGARFDHHTCQVVDAPYGRVEQEGQPMVFASDWLTGCCMLMKRRVIDTVGLLDERFFIYWEDVDWGLRLHASGLRNMVVPSANIWHKISVTMGGMDSPRRVYHKTRSHLLFARLHAPHSLPILLKDLLRDITWLLVKSSDRERFRKVRAYLAAMKDHTLGRTGRGPEWLWQDG